MYIYIYIVVRDLVISSIQLCISILGTSLNMAHLKSQIISLEMQVKHYLIKNKVMLDYTVYISHIIL
jgi:hypothetical protein